MKHTLKVALILFSFLTACSTVVTNQPAFTNTPYLEIIPTKTNAPTPSPRETPIPPIETVPIAQESINDFIGAAQKAGFDITSEQLLEEGFTIQTIIGANGKQYKVATVYLDPDASQQGEALEGNYPLMIKTETEWRKLIPRDLKTILGIDIGISADASEEIRNRSYLETVNLFPLLVPDGAFMHRNMQKYPNATPFFFELAHKDEMTLRISIAFWRKDIPESIKSANSEQVEKYMDDRVEEVMKYAEKGKKIEIIFANEAFWARGWDGSVFYNTFGSRWIEKAYLKLYKAAENKGLIVGQDVILIYGDDAMDMPNEKSVFAQSQLRTFKTNIAKELGLPENQVPLEIMLQFHLHADDANARGWETIHVNNLDEIKIMESLKNFGEIGSVHIGEIDISGTTDPIIKSIAIAKIASACKKMSVCKSITFWNPLWFSAEAIANPGLFNSDYTFGMPYFVLLKAMTE
jgi:hypothetical protein